VQKTRRKEKWDFAKYPYSFPSSDMAAGAAAAAAAAAAALPPLPKVTATAEG